MKEVQTLSEKDRRLMIVEKLAEKGMSQQDLADELGRSLTTIQKWIAGLSTPEVTFEEAIEFCESLGCTLEELAQMFPGRSRRRAAIRAAVIDKKKAAKANALKNKTPET